MTSLSIARRTLCGAALCLLVQACQRDEVSSGATGITKARSASREEAPTIDPLPEPPPPTVAAAPVASSLVRLPQPKGPLYDDPAARLVYEITGCPRGDCPAYLLTVERDGKIRFVGKKWVAKSRGERTLSAKATRALFDEVDGMAWSLRPAYEGPREPRAATAKLGIHFEGGPRVVTDSPVCSGAAAKTSDGESAASALCDLHAKLQRLALPYSACANDDCPEYPDAATAAAARAEDASTAGTLLVQCDPACESIKANDRSFGPSPINVRLPAGIYTIRLGRAGTAAKTVSTTIVAGKISRVQVAMQ